jgi:hypothetical protein
MVTRGERLDDAGRAGGLQPREQHRALHLRARDIRRVLDGREIRAAAHRERRPSIVGLDRGAHALERDDDALHRPAAQRLVAGHGGRQRVCRQHPCEHANRGAGIARVEHTGGRLQAAEPAPGDAQPQPVGVAPQIFDRDAETSQALERGTAVGAGRVAGNLRHAIGQCGKHRVPVRDGFVARRTYPPPHRAGRMHHDAIGRLSRSCR